MKINIVRQNVLKYRRVRLVKRMNALITFGSIGLFTLAVIYMTGQFLFLNVRQKNLSVNVAELTATYNSRAKEVAEYVAIKEIAGVVNDISSKRFGYKEFLSAVYALLPPQAALSSVDFGEKGVMVAGVRLFNLNDYDVLVSNIRQAESNKQSLFSAVAQKQLARDKNGSYLVTLELKLKNGG